MKKKLLIFLTVLLASINTANARPFQDSLLDLVDIAIYRPLGLVSTVAGTGIFIGISPFTALTAISPPHNAFGRAATILIVTPAKFTFDRPLGVYYPDDDGEYRL
ncbi:MAG: hypothetical protein ACU84H_13415 [Gammaproteobacteria bacterium]